MRLFFYGTLLDRDVRRAVLGMRAAALHGRPARLPDHRCVAVPGRTYPTLVPAPGARVCGAVFDGVSGPIRDALARYEGEEYVLREAVLTLATGAVVRAGVFMPAEPVPADRPDWRLATWRRRHKALFLAGLRVGTGEAGDADRSRPPGARGWR